MTDTIRPLAAWRVLLPSLLVFSTGIGLTVAIILLAPRRYQSEVKLLLKLGRENVSLDPTVAISGETAAVYRTNESEVNTLLQMMQSQAVLDKVVEEVGADVVLRGSLVASTGPKSAWSDLKDSVRATLAQIDPIDTNELARMRLQQDLAIHAGKGSNVVSIACRAATAELAHHLTQTWVDIYRSEHARMTAVDGSLEFFQTQEVLLKDTLNQARDRLSEGKSRSGVVTVAGRQADLESQLQSTRSALISNQAALAGARARLKSLQSTRDSVSEKVVMSELRSDSNDAQNAMRDRLYQLEIEEGHLAATYHIDHPTLLAVRKQVADARAVLTGQVGESGEVVQGVNPLYTSVMDKWTTAMAELQAIEAAAAEQQATLGKLEQELVTLNRHEAELAGLERDVEVLESGFRTHFERREQARLSAELERSQISNINVVQQARLQRRPVSPNKKMCGLLGLLGSASAAVGCGFLIATRCAAQPVRSSVANVAAGRVREREGDADQGFSRESGDRPSWQESDESAPSRGEPAVSSSLSFPR